MHFFEDFSRTPPGQKPVAWATGVAGLVTTLDGLPGHWAVMAGDHNLLTPRELTKPLPQDFTVSYELVAARNFTSGARGLTFQLAREISGQRRLLHTTETASRVRWPGRRGRYRNELSRRLRGGTPVGAGRRVLERQDAQPDSGLCHEDGPDELQVYIDGAKIAEYEKGVLRTCGSMRCRSLGAATSARTTSST